MELLTSQRRRRWCLFSRRWLTFMLTSTVMLWLTVHLYWPIILTLLDDTVHLCLLPCHSGPGTPWPDPSACHSVTRFTEFVRLWGWRILVVGVDGAGCSWAHWVKVDWASNVSAVLRLHPLSPSPHLHPDWMIHWDCSRWTRKWILLHIWSFFRAWYKERRFDPNSIISKTSNNEHFWQ